MFESEHVNLNQTTINESPVSFFVDNIKIELNQHVDAKKDSKQKVKSKARFKEEKLLLVCEWNGCGNSFETWSTFQLHIENHLNDFILSNANNNRLNECAWKDCDFKEYVVRELVRHVHFHSYHTKLMCHGRNAFLIDETNFYKIKTACSMPRQKVTIPEQFRCEWPDCVAESIDWLRPFDFFDHVKGHALKNGDESYLCLWSTCELKKDFGCASKLKEHLRSHLKEKMIACPECGMMFANRIKFFDHCRRQDFQDAKFSCDRCGKNFVTERMLKDHIRAHTKLYNCHLCRQTCNSPSTLKTHIKYKHTNDKPFMCPLLHCDYACKSNADLKSHAKSHGNDTAKCHMCDYSTKFMQTLKCHIKQYHDLITNIYACHICDYKDTKSHKLSSHLANQHGIYSSKDHSRFYFVKQSKTGFYQIREDTAEYRPKIYRPIGKEDTIQNRAVKDPLDFEEIADSIGVDIKSDEDVNNEKFDCQSQKPLRDESFPTTTKDDLNFTTMVVKRKLKNMILEQLEAVQNKEEGSKYKCKVDY